MLRIISVTIMLQLSFFSNHCGECRDKPGSREYSEVSNISYRNDSERVEKFLSYSIENQIDIYLFAKECAGDDRISGIFYNTGKDKIPDIVKKIADSNDEKDKMNLIWSLMWIDYKCGCVKNDLETIKTLVKAESKSKDTDSASIKSYKERYSTTLNLLKNENNIKPH